MKVHRTITLEEDIQKQLIGINASELINTLLYQHFHTTTTKKDKKQQEHIQSQINTLQEEQDTIQQSINKEKMIKSIKLHPLLLQWVKLLKRQPSAIQVSMKVKSLGLKPSLQLREQITNSYNKLR